MTLQLLLRGLAARFKKVFCRPVYYCAGTRRYFGSFVVKGVRVGDKKSEKFMSFREYLHTFFIGIIALFYNWSYSELSSKKFCICPNYKKLLTIWLYLSKILTYNGNF